MLKICTVCAAILMIFPVYAHEMQDESEIYEHISEEMKRVLEEARSHWEKSAIDGIIEMPDGAKVFIDEHLRSGAVAEDRASLGLFLVNSNGRLVVAHVNPLKRENEPNSDVLPGDVLLAIDGERLEDENASVEHVIDYLRTVEVGAEVTLTIERDGDTILVPTETHSIKDVSGGVIHRPKFWTGWRRPHGSQDEIEIHIEDEHTGHIEIFPHSTRYPGSAEFTDLNEDLAEFFSAEQGVLVTRATDPSELRAGDVIVEVDGNPISSFHELMDKIHDGETVTVMRRNETIEMDAEVVTQGLAIRKEIRVFTDGLRRKGERRW